MHRSNPFDIDLSALDMDDLARDGSPRSTVPGVSSAVTSGRSAANQAVTRSQPVVRPQANDVAPRRPRGRPRKAEVSEDVQGTLYRMHVCLNGEALNGMDALTHPTRTASGGRLSRSEAMRAVLVALERSGYRPQRTSSEEQLTGFLEAVFRKGAS